MKKETHPHRVQSIIQMKDGAVYVKKWLYFRSNLQLEVDFTTQSFWKKAPQKIKQNSEKK